MDDVPSARAWIETGRRLRLPSGHEIAYRRTGAGPAVLLVHGFPTWSYDWAPVAAELAADHDVVTFDFLGYGASDKPNPYRYSVEENADTVERLVAHLGLETLHLVVHDYGATVGQEILDRHRRGVLPFGLESVTLFNGGIVYAAYRPTHLQRLLIAPVIGSLVSRLATARTFRRSLDGVRGEAKLTDEEFEQLWYGVALRGGHHLAHLLIHYNTERARHHERWEAALAAWSGRLHLIWGPQDPVSGQHVLDAARARLPQAMVTALPGVGHFPMSEAPAASAAAIRAGLDASADRTDDF